ncbi:hypothetical protein [Peribacillus sp. SCS-155]|uniref:hypothetical protein n=1 Tax=Peribacillus sedimenti TaxID=3115297 RepID=UPI003905FC00
MSKKKAIKVATASAIAASAFAAVAPVQSEAAVNYTKTVTDAQKAMKAPFDTYYKTGNTGKTVSASTVDAQVKKGWAAYKSASATVKKAGKSSKQLQAKLDAYKVYLTRSEQYVAALNEVTKIYAQAKTALTSENEAQIKAAIAVLKNSKNKGHVGIGKVYGPNNRAVLKAAFNRISQSYIKQLEAALEALAPKVASASAIDATTVELKLENTTTVEKFEGVTIQGQETREVGEVTVSEDGKTVTLSDISPALNDGREYVVKLDGKTLAKSGFKYTAPVVTPDPVAPEAPVVSGNGVVAKSVTPVVTSVEGVQYSAVLEKDGVAVNGYELGSAVTVDGSYKLTVTATRDGLTATTTVNFTVDTQAPTLEVNEDAVTVYENTFKVEGKTEAGAKLSVNGEEVTVGEDGSFSKEFTLEAGKTTFEVSSEDAAGNKATKSKEVTFDNTVVVATEAVTAYEAATVAKYADIATVNEAKKTAQDAVTAVTKEDAKAELQAKVDAKAKAVEDQLAAKVAAVNAAVTAGNQITLDRELAFFTDYDATLLLDYAAEISAETKVEDIQTAVYSVNTVEKVQNSFVAYNTANTVDQLKLFAAIEYGAKTGVLTNVNLDVYFGGYVSAAVDASGSAITGSANVDSISEIQTKIINPAPVALVTAAQTKVDEVEAAFTGVLPAGVPTATLINEAQAAVNALPADSTVVGDPTPKKDLQAELDSYVSLKEVLLAVHSGLQSNIAAALNNNTDTFARVNTAFIVNYTVGGDRIDGNETTVAAVQAQIDAANVTAVDSLVEAAQGGSTNAEAVTTEKYQAAKDALAFVKDDVAGTTTKADFVSALDDVKAILDVINANNADQLLAALKSTELGLTVADADKSTYWTVFSAVEDKNVALNTATKINTQIITGSTTAKTTAAVNAVKNAASASALLEALKNPVLSTTTLVVNDALATEYFAKLASVKDSLSSDANIKTTLVDAVNAEELEEAVDAVTTVVDGAATPTDLDSSLAADKATIVTLLNRLGVVSSDFDETKVDTTLAGAYIDALKTEVQLADDPEALINWTTATDAAKAAAIEDVIVAKNDAAVTDAMDAIQTAADLAVNTDALKATFLTLLKEQHLALENVVDANIDAYATDKAIISSNISATAIATDKATLQNAINTINAVVALNKATTPAEVRAALVDFVSTDAGSDVDGAYLDLSNQSKLEVAELVLADRNDNTPNPVFADAEAVKASLGATVGAGALQAHVTILNGVNTLTSSSSFSQVEAALNAVNYTAFDSLSTTDRLAVAETFKGNLTFIATGDNAGDLQTPFTSLSAIKQAIQTAINAQ